MKKTVLLIALFVLTSVSTIMTASPVAEITNDIIVVKEPGKQLYHLYYESRKAENVKVVVMDEYKNRLFSKTIKNTKGFTLPINFLDANEGKYEIMIQDGTGTTFKAVEVSAAGNMELVSSKLSKVEDGKIRLTVSGPITDEITVYIYDDEKLLFQDEISNAGGFTKLYDLRSVPSRALTFLVASDLVTLSTEKIYIR
ncbi:MAG: hypothetical protein AAF388_03215 [Bacteroidota bacterium]